MYSVRLSCSSGPPCDSAHRSTPAPSDASTNASRTSGCSSESSASIASDCEPCPGNTNASVEAVTHEPCEKASRDDTGEPAPASVPGRIDGGPGLGIWDWGFGKAGSREIGRAHVCTPVTNAQFVCRLLHAKKKTKA